MLYTKVLDCSAAQTQHHANQKRRVVGALALALIAVWLPGIAAAAAGAWTPRSSPPDVLEDGAVVVLPNGLVMVAGGIKSAGRNTAASAEVELYDPNRDVWSVAAPMPSPRYAASATVLANGFVLVAGGYGQLPADRFAAAPILATSVLYDFTKNSWTATGELPYPETGATVSLLTDGRALLAGGTGPEGALADVSIFDPGRETWSRTSSMHSARLSASSVPLADGEVLVVGGTSGPGQILDDAELFDPSSDKWRLTPPMHAARFEAAILSLGDGRVLVAGGQTGLGAGPGADIYDPRANTWSEPPSMPIGGIGSAFKLANGNVLVLLINGADRTVHTALLDPRTGNWAIGPDQRISSAQPAYVELSSGTVLVIADSTVASFGNATLPPPNGTAIVANTANSSSTTAVLAGSLAVLLLLSAILYWRSRLDGRSRSA